MSIDGKIINGVRWLIDSTGALVGYRNPLRDVDVELPAGAPTGSQIVAAIDTELGSADWQTPGGGSAITVQDEGTPLATAMTVLNITGAGATVTGEGATKTLNIPGAGTATITVKENGAEVSAVVTALDFLGADFDVTESPSGEVNIVISSAVARVASPTLTGTPAAPTAAPGTNTTQISTTAFVQAAVAALINSAPGALDTLDELAAAMGDDANFAASVTTALAGKQPIDATLTAIAALTIAANSLSIGSGADAFSQVTFGANTFPARASTGNLVAKAITDFGLSLLDDADGAAVLATLGGTAATGTGGVVRATAPTISALTATGVTTYDGATVVTVNAMGALAIDTSKPNTKSISADSTFTFSAQPVTDTWFSLYVTNTDTAPHILTIPSCFSFATQAARTTFPIAASGQLYLVFRHRGSGAYTVIGDSAFFNKFDATAAPGVGDDVADGYGPGSLWMDVTGNALYVCETNGAGAAVWTLIGGGSGDMVLASVQTVTGEKTFGSAGAVGKLKVAGNTSGSTTIAAAAVAGTTTFTLPAVSGTAATLAGTETLTAKQVHLAAVPGTDDTYEGQAITGRNAGATIAQWEAVYLGSGGTWLLADADGSSTQPARGLAVAAYTSGNAAVVLDNGVARNDAWAWTVGGDIYLSTTAGGLTQTAPVTGFVQKMGYALSADTMRVAIGSSEILGL